METQEYLANQFKKLTTIYYALLFGMLMVFGIAVLLTSQTGAFMPEAARSQILRFWIPVVIIGLIPLSYMLYNGNTKNFRQESDLKAKTDAFVRASILRLAMLEAAGTLAAVSFILTNSRQNTYLFVAVVVFFLLATPGPGRFINDLNIRGEDKKTVEQTLRRRK